MKRLLLVLALASSALPRPASAQADPHVVVALIDTGINPYNVAFRDHSSLAYAHPSTYIPGYPADTPALNLHLDESSYDEAVALDADVWASVQDHTLYWIPGTRIIGVYRMQSGTTACGDPVPPPVPATGTCTERKILDDVGHGTMTVSRAAAASHSLAPEARIVEIEGLGNRSVDWAAQQGWIDVQSNSWLSLVPNPLGAGLYRSFRNAAKSMLVLAATGNGAAYSQGFAPTPTYVLSTAAPGVILVGAHDNGKATLWSGSPPHVVADGYGGWRANHLSVTDFSPHPMACCTSAASPYAAGGGAAVILEARRILGDGRTGVHDGIVAHGPAGLVPSGPLADGDFTLQELRDVFLHTAQARPGTFDDDGLVHWLGEPRVPDYAEWGPGANPFCQGCWTMPVPWTAIPQDVPAYPYLGYGSIDHDSLALASALLHGTAELPARPTEDALFAADQALREVLYPAA